ncbi:MAG: hypothetical protein WEA61_01660 [Anaerolineales bacterium]
MQDIDVQRRINRLIHVHARHAQIIGLVNMAVSVQEIEIETLFRS